MKISILTGKFGMGHMIVAKAMEEHIKNSYLEAEVEIIDWFDYVSPKLAERYYIFFEAIVNKGFKLYNTRYRLLEDKKTDQKPELYSYFKWHFKKYIQEKRPDVIISTVPLCSQIASLYKEKTGSTIPLITCVTDITGHSEWINKNTDFYMVGSYVVKDKFVMKGVSPEKIHETGIPVRLGFTKKEEAKLPEGKHIRKRILIMGGGLGMLPIDNEFYKELECLSKVDIIIITGKNHSLFHQLSGKFKNITVLGYIYNVYDYMKQADVVITKPGGVTTFEAINAEVPILALNPFLQQEMYNAQYILEMNIGKIINVKDKEVLQDIKDVLEDGQLELYKNNMMKIKSRLNENIVTLTQFIEKTIEHSNKEVCFKNIVKSLVLEECKASEKISFNV